MDDAPLLSEKHVRNARLLASRYDILGFLGDQISFVEVGVALGDFSEAVLATKKIAKFVAIDMFDMERWPETWGGRVGRELNGRNHYSYYEEKFRHYIQDGVMSLMAGDSVKSLQLLPPASQDVIYLDSDHAYEHIKRELAIAKDIIKPGGLLVLNDYIMYDHMRMVPYGVPQAANEFLLREDWEILFFALHTQMFCDIVIRKIV